MKRLLMALSLAGAVAALAAQAATAGSTQVSGKQIWTADPAHSIMTGSLVGDWYDTTVEMDVRIHPSGTIQARGTELFVGCMESVCGTLTFEYHAELKIVFDPFQLIRGRCWHQVTGGTGGFEGASGILNFEDDPVNGCSYYTGHITLP